MAEDQLTKIPNDERRRCMSRFYTAQTIIRMRKLVMCSLIVFAAAVSLMVDNPAMGYSGEGWSEGNSTCDKSCLECKQRAVYDGLLEMELCESDDINQGDKSGCMLQAYEKVQRRKAECESQ
jgi:hypothetical protein